MESSFDTPVPADSTLPEPLPSAPPHRSRWLREIVDTALLTAIIFLLVNAATGRFLIKSVSMQPNLHEGEYVIVDKVTYLVSAPQRGDIVVFDLDGEPDDLIKRMIGLPGETIEISDGIVYINGQPLEESYAAPAPGSTLPARRLGTDEYFVMGDNRSNSRDSRIFGPIHRETIVGRAWIIYWPPSDWSIVPHHVYAEGG
ncbi:MAG TPA: signal peptidase I [Anaerolineae bacterium]|nr:signal peptidase I [Anaerolineae bacterium]